MKVYKRRGCTFILNNNCDSFQKMVEEEKRYRNCCQEIFNLTRKLMVDGEILSRTFGSFCDLCLIKDSRLYFELFDYISEKKEINKKTGEETTLYTITPANLVKTIYKDIFSKYQFSEKGISTYRRGVVEYVINRIEGSWERNKSKKKYQNGKIPFVSFKGGVIHVAQDINYFPEDNKISIPHSSGKIEVPIYKYISKGMPSKNFGGNLIFKYDTNKNVYAIILKGAVEIYQEPAYTPDGFIGFDINQEAKYWIVMNNGEMIARPDHVTNLIKRNKNLNKLIANDDKQKTVISDDGTIYKNGLNSKQRRKCRLEQIDVLKEIQKSTKKFAEDIVQKAINSNKGVAIDKIEPGAKNGEFGQFISRYVIAMCEDLRVPFYVCPSAYSSRRCVCGNIDPKNRKDDIFKCVECGHQDNSHIHAAKNMSRIANELYNNSCIFASSRGYNVEKTIEALHKTKEKIEKKLLTRDPIAV